MFSLCHTLRRLTDKVLHSCIGKYLYRQTVGSPENVNSAIEQFTYVGDVTNEVDRVKLSLFGVMVQEPLFDQLRAKEQLGYIVSPDIVSDVYADTETVPSELGVEWRTQVDWFHGITSDRSIGTRCRLPRDASRRFLGELQGDVGRDERGRFRQVQRDGRE